MIRSIVVDAARIRNWNTFHDVFAEAFGFPEFYGRNLDAWIDCMTRLDEDGFSDFSVTEGNLVLLHLSNADALKKVAPNILSAVLEMAGFVNFRRVETGSSPILIVSCYA